ncbi:N-(5-amino-5-carboxypentanoyl)-L-cysteinyl-D-valine synthase [Emericellopsis cladophorae]|uniref:N-(5-amino-5-carboxypentanoyl)-L-cysteinyl-D-valine synthase n=1 Tax=Emericellopsis cladophorae TaxID=2686198 RepID=A0A9Q0BDN9_9HYPO|nr:N-(5-amino-5-carboxypentanoyl)-L-cysteinyl-D-valine synthase [Emericellopsis cladophorae]KAI6781567.1 N-(5-amino-5-carboxypentanoyl)-L-cysteinyl-D-valine synthase [Emericellopsis cladophorae]
MASKGENTNHGNYEQRKAIFSKASLASLKQVCSVRALTPEALILFGAHQTLKGLGGGSTTVSASLFPQCNESSWQYAWTALTSMVDHTTRNIQTVDAALVKNATPFPRFSCDGPDMELVEAERLVKSGLLDIVVVFEYGRENALLPHFPLILGVNIKDQAWELTIGYDHSLFDAIVIESILSAFHTVLMATTMPSQLVKNIELLSCEQEARLTEWNNTDGKYPSQKRLNHLFEDIATQQGDKVALIYGEKRITYDALNVRANGLAQQISSLSVLPEQLIVLFLEKSDMMIATILGVWKSGAAHVPVDPAYPDERVRFVLNDTQARVIVASRRYTKRLRENVVEDREIRIYVIEDLLAAVDQTTRTSAGCTNIAPPTPLTSKQLAYVTYTSGTTGLPKGIYKEHTSVVNSITDLAGRYGIAGANDEVVLLFSAYVFEPFVRQMLMALTTGNTLAIISDEEKFDPDTLLPFIKSNHVTYLNGTASVLLEYDFSSCASLKRIVLVGETLTDARYQALRQRFRGCILSEYGFTESAFVTALKSFDFNSQRTDMSLGRPVRNVKCYILGPSLKKVPIGVPGELYVGGLGISRGYMNRPELTRQKFLLNPFQTAQEKGMGVNGLMYKTGDLARWLSNGEVEYLGRADFQIKLRGIRIEPGEIESNIATYPGVRASVVVSKKLLSQGKETSQDHLVGYYVCEQDPVSEADLIFFLETKLPRYMIPTRLVMLQTIPVTVNGKADLRALPAVEVEAGSNGSSEEHLDELEARLAQVFRTKTLANMAKLLRTQKRDSQSVSNGAKSQPHTNGVNGAADKGTTSSGRHLPVEGIEDAIGLFINTLPLIVDHGYIGSQNMTVLEALVYVQEKANEMNLRSNAELGRLLKADLKHGLFDSLFVLENYPNLDTDREIHRQQLRYTIEGGLEKLSYPLAAIAREVANDSCSFTLCYAGELFSDESVHTLLQTVRDVFECVSKNLHMDVGSFEFLSDKERTKLDQWNATECEYPNATLHALFEVEAQRKPDKVAVVYEDQRLTYRELNSRANSLAYELLQRVPVQPNKIIALVMQKSEHMITNILAIWKTGGAYVPIDPAYPDDRIQYILQDTGALAVITDVQYVERMRRVARHDVLVLESDFGSRLEQAALHPAIASSPADLAYIMYTSGTTGRPKGVMVEHHGVVNLCASLSKIFGLQDTDDEVILSFSNYVFDHFVEQMTDALLNGQTLVVLNDDMRGDKERLYRYIETNRVTYLSGTPSVISMYEFDRFASYLRRIDCVGEAFSEPVFEKIRSTFSGLIINGYGPTEVSITTNKRLYPFPERRTDKSIGQQIANSTSYVVDGQMKRVPIGAVGELYLGGDGVARGYHNRSDLTAERFPMNPFQNEIEKAQCRNGRLYKTGDLVRWIGEGEIEYLGRNDFQVKIRGQRIELGEIEAVLSSYPEVDQSVVLAKSSETDGQNQLLGYFVSAGSLSTRAIRRFMLGRLPDYMVPAKLVRIDKVPVTVSGKLDSKALPVPKEADQDEIIAPRTEIEQILANIWSELLEIPLATIGIYSDFFGLGGDSLKSTRFSFAATTALGVSVTVRDLFSHPTIEAMSNWVVRGSDGHSDVASLQGHALNNLPISPAQERLIFLHEFNTDGRAQNGAYNVPFHLRLRDDVVTDAFQQAIHDVVARHEALRTLFKCSNSQYRQEIIDQNTAKYRLKMETLTDLSPSEMEVQMALFDTHSFSIGSELPIRVQFYQPSNAGGSLPTFLSILFHHLAFDSWSWDIFERDLQVLYSARCGSPSPSSLPILRVQYKEYAVEHQKILTFDKRCSLESYWLQKLADLEPLRLVTDRPRPSQFDFSGSDVRINVEQETVIKLRELAKREGTTLYTVVLSAFMLLVNVYTNQQDITIGIPMSHRMHPDFGSSIGFFVNLLPLRVQVAQKNFCQLVRDVRKALLDSHVHQDLPFQEITKLLEHRHDPSRHPLVQLVFNWEAAAERGGPEDSLMTEYCPSNPLPSAAKFDLNVSVKETKGLLNVNFNYPTALFDADTIEGFIGTFIHILKEVAFMDAESRLDRLPAFEPTFHMNGHLGGNMVENQSGCSSLVELFELQVELRPDDIAVVSSAGIFTYAEVNRRANQLARLITSSYVLKRDDRIALLMGKDIDMVISILAVWKSGAAYIPLDPSYPPQRIALILQESNPRALLTKTDNYFELQTPCKVPVLVIDEAGIQERLKEISENYSSVSLRRPSDMAYIIFTSGTTGKPKGVIVEHGSVIQFRNALLERYFSGNTGSQAVLFLSNYVFDFSLEQLSLSILSGNKLVIPPEEGVTHEAFYELATEQQLSYVSGTPSVLQQICLSRLPHLRMITSAGEELQRNQYDTMRAQFKGIINNAYGITETTVYNIVTTFNDTEPFTKALCDSLPGTELFVLNDRLQELPADAVGELHIGGQCLARGYLNQDTLTNDRFIHHPFKRLPESSGMRQERLYKTGDLVRKRRSGFLEYLGRRDQQVKLRGFRIELSEIRESVLSIPQVKDSAVIALYDETESSSRVAKGLACYYTVENDKDLSSLEIHTALLSRLPSFMVPGQLHQVQGSLPVTVNGKIDVSRLAQTRKPQSIKSTTAPRNDLEKTLCQLWASLLNISHCGIDDDLFALGGDSISSLRLVGDVHSTLGRKITVKDIFLHRTVRALSENVLSAQPAAELNGYYTNKPSRSATGDAPLTPIQRWFQRKDLQHPEFWNHCFTIRTPILSVDQLQNALKLLQDRHDVLRMRLKPEDGNNVQSFPPDCQEPDISVLDASSFESTEALSEVLGKINSRLDLYEGPLYAMAYIPGLEDGSARIWCAFHHLIMDTVSWNIICTDLEALYHGKGLGLKGGNVQEWALALAEYNMTLAEKAYWNMARRKMTEGFKKLPQFSQSRFQRAWKMTSRDTASLTRLASVLDTSMHDILLVAVSRGLQDTTQHSPGFIAIESHGREEIFGASLDVSRAVGWFTSMYPFEIPVVDDLVQGIIDVKTRASQVPRNGIAYGPIFGYDQDSLPLVSFNYLGRLGKRKMNASEWMLVHEEGYPQGLCTSPADANKSGSMIDLTFSIQNDQLTAEVDCGWGQEALKQLTLSIQQTLTELTTTSPQDPAAAVRPQNTHHSGYTPYFIFEGESRSGRPLFLLPPGEGGAESYFRNVIQSLPERNMVAFNNYYREHKDLDTIEQLAEYYLSLIRDVQPEGPYDILGWSFGGIIGLEVAARLIDGGESIRMLGLIDPFFDITSATKAIDHKGTILDPIYDVYQPPTNAFQAVEERAEHIVLFKATTYDEKHQSAPERQLFKWYAASPANNLDNFWNNSTASLSLFVTKLWKNQSSIDEVETIILVEDMNRKAPAFGVSGLL